MEVTLCIAISTLEIFKMSNFMIRICLLSYDHFHRGHFLTLALRLDNIKKLTLFSKDDFY